MRADVPESRPRPGVPEQWGTRAAFLAAGLAVAAWAPLVPFAKSSLALDEGELGLLLLCMGLGSILAMPFSGGLAARLGCRAVIVAGCLVAGVALPFLATAASVPALAVALAAFGAGIGTVDVTMNIQAVIVEKGSGRAMMSGFHGLYSVGGIAGAGAVTGLIALGVSPLGATLAVVGTIAALLAGFGRGLLPYGSEEESPPFALPRGRVLLFGALCFVLFLAEGAVLDWSGVFLTSARGLDPGYSGLGYVAFATTMTLGRLTGDAQVRALGPRRILLYGGLCAAAGFLLVVLVPSWIASAVGFALVGAGASNTVPVLFTAAGRQTAMPTNLAIAAVTTLGYLGILAGPAIVGFVARAAGLSFSLAIVALLLTAVAFCARVVAEGTSPSTE